MYGCKQGQINKVIKVNLSKINNEPMKRVMYMIEIVGIIIKYVAIVGDKTKTKTKEECWAIQHLWRD